MKDKKTTFIFRTEWMQYFDMLEGNDLNKCLHIISEYVENQTEPKKPNLSDRLLMIWLFLKSQIDKDNIKYDKRCETSKENGKKGGRPKKDKNLKNLKNPEKHDYEHDSDYDNEHDYEYIISAGADINIYTYIENNFGRTLSPIEYETISNWKDNELTRYAIKKAVLNGKHNITYISRILESYSTKGITTVVQAQQEEEDFKNQKEQMKKYQGVGFKESKADWQNVEIEENTATADEISELEERIKGR